MYCCCVLFVLFQIFDGNQYPNKLGLIKHDLSKEVEARFVKIYIIDFDGRGATWSQIACTNIEFFGC